jgi:hypothetical protein
MLLLALCAGCARAAVEYSGRCVAAPAPTPSVRDAAAGFRWTWGPLWAAPPDVTSQGLGEPEDFKLARETRRA